MVGCQRGVLTGGGGRIGGDGSPGRHAWRKAGGLPGGALQPPLRAAYPDNPQRTRSSFLCPLDSPHPAHSSSALGREARLGAEETSGSGVRASPPLQPPSPPHLIAGESSNMPLGCTDTRSAIIFPSSLLFIHLVAGSLPRAQRTLGRSTRAGKSEGKCGRGDSLASGDAAGWATRTRSSRPR